MTHLQELISVRLELVISSGFSLWNKVKKVSVPVMHAR
jgi:hypothetical protein